LVAALGGNAAVPAIYDGRLGVTVGGGVVSAWADARGGGFGPSLVASGTKQPSFTVDHLVFDGVNNVLACAVASALFDVSGPYSFALIGFSNANGNFAGLADGSTANRILLLQTAGGVYASNVGSPHVTVSSVIAQGTTNLLAIASSGAATGNIDVPNTARVTSAITLPGAGNNFLSLGAYAPTGAGPKACTVFSVVCINHVVTASDIVALDTYAVIRGATLQ
jgi:hypothetical protein